MEKAQELIELWRQGKTSKLGEINPENLEALAVSRHVTPDEGIILLIGRTICMDVIDNPIITKTPGGVYVVEGKAIDAIVCKELWERRPGFLRRWLCNSKTKPEEKEFWVGSKYNKENKIRDYHKIFDYNEEVIAL